MESTENLEINTLMINSFFTRTWRQCNGEIVLSKKIISIQLDSHMQRMVDSFLISCPKLRITDLWELKLKILEENKGVSLCDFELGKVALDMTPKAQATKEKQIRPHQNERLLCKQKYTESKQRMTKWEKNTCKSYIYKGLVSRYIKNY